MVLIPYDTTADNPDLLAGHPLQSLSLNTDTASILRPRLFVSGNHVEVPNSDSIAFSAEWTGNLSINGNFFNQLGALQKPSSPAYHHDQPERPCRHQRQHRQRKLERHTSTLQSSGHHRTGSSSTPSTTNSFAVRIRPGERTRDVDTGLKHCFALAAQALPQRASRSAILPQKRALPGQPNGAGTKRT